MACVTSIPRHKKYNMGVLNLDALINDLDATLLELEIQSEELAPPPPPKKATGPSQTELLAQQQAQLNLQQQLIEAQTALLRQQQQLNTPPNPATPLAPGIHTATANLQHNQLPGGYQPARRQPPHSLPQRSHQELPHLNFQHPQEQFNDYNKNLRTWTADSPRKVAVFSPTDPSFSPSSNGDLYSLLSGSSSNSPGIDGGGVFGAKDKTDSETVTSSEKKKRGWFGGSSAPKEHVKDSKEAAHMVGLLEGAGF